MAYDWTTGFQREAVLTYDDDVWQLDESSTSPAADVSLGEYFSQIQARLTGIASGSSIDPCRPAPPTEHK
jgi:hypothetical protein